MDAGFIIRRLGRMSLPEVLYRTMDGARTAWDRGTYRHREMEASLREPGTLKIPEMNMEMRDSLQAKADAYCMHRFDVFALKEMQLGFPICHEQDIKSGKSAPKGLFSGNIDYRDHEKIGDIKYIWEPSRHLHFPVLALAWRVLGDRKYLECLEADLQEWVDANPFLTGIHWTSPLEMGIRLINWTLAWQWAGADFDDTTKRKLGRSSALHMSHINRHYSGYSSANNHLVGEAAGVLIGSLGLVECAKTERWKRKAYDILLRELRLQNGEDGVNREQALSYQQFVLDFYLIAFGCCVQYHVPVPETAYVTLGRMLWFLAACQTAGGEPMTYGDDDDGLVIYLLQSCPGIYQSLIHTGHLLFDISPGMKPEAETDPMRVAGTEEERPPATDIKSTFYQVLFRKTGASLDAAKSAIRRALAPRVQSGGLFPDGGYAFLGKDFSESSEQKLMFDFGKLGYLSISAHGHADALSFSFSAGGKNIFVDPGTYAYHTQQKWRNWFRGTSAHNALVVDDTNQSVIEGDFMWGRKATCVLMEHVPFQKVVASHDGYLSLPDGVLHERSIEFSPDQNKWIIRDNLRCMGKHKISIYFHLHPEARVTEEKDGVWMVRRGNVTVALLQDKKTVAVLSEGDAMTPAGWFSPSYDVRIPAQSLCFSSEIIGKETFEHTFTALLLEDER